jgi:ribose-phosphate pyrophosphokinase
VKIIPGPASKQLGEKIAELLNVKTISVTSRIFPDGESYVRLEGDLQNEEVVIVQTTSPPQDTKLLQAAFLTDAAKRNGAAKVTIVTPYLAYARQDKVFLQGEALSIETIGKMLKAAGTDRIVTVNVHQSNALKKFPFPAQDISAIPLLAKYFKDNDFDKAFALAPDAGATNIAEEAGSVLGGEYGHLEKHRNRHTGQVMIERQNLNVAGKTVIIFDDIISSGGTIVEAARTLKELKASKICVACVHPLLIEGAEKKILETGVEEIVGTDSVPSNVSKVSLAPLIAKHLSN